MHIGRQARKDWRQAITKELEKQTMESEEIKKSQRGGAAATATQGEV